MDIDPFGVLRSGYRFIVRHIRRVSREATAGYGVLFFGFPAHILRRFPALQQRARRSLLSDADVVPGAARPNAPPPHSLGVRIFPEACEVAYR